LGAEAVIRPHRHMREVGAAELEVTAGMGAHLTVLPDSHVISTVAAEAEQFFQEETGAAWEFQVPVALIAEALEEMSSRMATTHPAQAGAEVEEGSAQRRWPAAEMAAAENTAGEAEAHRGPSVEATATSVEAVVVLAVAHPRRASTADMEATEASAAEVEAPVIPCVFQAGGAGVVVGSAGKVMVSTVVAEGL